MTLIEQIKSQPKKRRNVPVSMLAISEDTLSQLRKTAMMHNVPMGRIAEIAIARLITEIDLTVDV
jgi:hypothetical protein